MYEGNEMIVEAKHEDFAEMLMVWEESVRKTHHFLQEKDICEIRPAVTEAFMQMEALVCVKNTDGEILGFMGIAQRKIEMLFLHPASRGRGIGKLLIQYAVCVHDAEYVDVNEQNECAVGFYLHLGFVTIGRDAEDSMGRPLPILHMYLRRG